MFLLKAGCTDPGFIPRARPDEAIYNQTLGELGNDNYNYNYSYNLSNLIEYIYKYIWICKIWLYTCTCILVLYTDNVQRWRSFGNSG